LSRIFKEATMKFTETRPGVPCWYELASTDPAKSFAFHHALFGWSRTDMDMPMGTYSFLANGNGTVGAMWPMPPEQAAAGTPSYWAVYFLVADCDAATAQAVALGGSVVMPPMDVENMGRMSVLTDPTGATFSLWQSKGDGGGDMVFDEDYAMCWVELATRDVSRAREFYAALLGWTYTESPLPMSDNAVYAQLSAHGVAYGGMLPMDKNWGDIPPHWAVYVRVPDVDAALARATELGGSVCVPAFDAPGVGRIGMLTDPTGANAYVITLAAG
jgi:predicted enzyme related to lactoylglutathione lyase